jgi:putative membrane protein
MIVRPRPTLFSLLFAMRGSILPTIAPRILLVAGFSAVVALAQQHAPGSFPELTVVPFTLVGLALSIFLGFRNNACYERWWEGRRQWGALVAESRSFLRDTLTLVPNDPELHRRLALRVIAFADELRTQLRTGAPNIRSAYLPASETQPGMRAGADAVLWLQAREIALLLRGGAVSDILYRGLTDRLDAMTGIQAACERIRSTPTPYTYTLLLHRTAWLFCLLLPFGLASTLGLATTLACTILAYAFFGLDALGDELEEPFGLSHNALPLDALVRVIEISALEAIGEPAPEPLKPIDFILT